MSTDIPDEIMDVRVDKEFFRTLEKLDEANDASLQLSRPRHRLDTTDEWLLDFYYRAALTLLVLELLGDQTDLVPDRIPLHLFTRAAKAHHGDTP